MKRIFGGSSALALVASLVALAAPSAASALPPLPLIDCDSEPGTSQPCTQWCDRAGERVPCDFRNLPSGVYGYNVAMSGATQTASGIPGEPGATGTASITLDLNNNRFCSTTYWSGINSKVAAGHIHQGMYGQPENPAVWISLMNPDFINGVQSGVHYCEIVPAAELWAIKQCPAYFHTVVHSQNYPAGSIRGQLGTACRVV